MADSRIEELLAEAVEFERIYAMYLDLEAGEDHDRGRTADDGKGE